jgi:hypothetical protein
MVAAADGMLDIRDAAAFLGYKGTKALRKIVDRSKAQAQGARAKGPTIKFFQVGPRAPIRFQRQWLLEFIDDHTVDPSMAATGSKPVKRKRCLPDASHGFDSAFWR